MWNWKAFIKPLGWFTYDIIKSGWNSSEVNNGKGQTIKLINEISEVNNKIKELNNQNSQNIQEQYEARIEQPINIKDCIIM